MAGIASRGPRHAGLEHLALLAWRGRALTQTAVQRRAAAQRRQPSDKAVGGPAHYAGLRVPSAMTAPMARAGGTLNSSAAEARAQARRPSTAEASRVAWMTVARCEKPEVDQCVRAVSNMRYDDERCGENAAIATAADVSSFFLAGRIGVAEVSGLDQRLDLCAKSEAA